MAAACGISNPEACSSARRGWERKRTTGEEEGELECVQSKRAGWGSGTVGGGGGGSWREGKRGGSRALVRYQASPWARGIGMGCGPRQVTEVWQAGDVHRGRL